MPFKFYKKTYCLFFQKIKIINECYEEGKQTLMENRSLLDLLAQHLVEIETLTKEDINELVETGKLSWWEKKKAKLNEQMAALNETKPEEQPQQPQEEKAE